MSLPSGSLEPSGKVRPSEKFGGAGERGWGAFVGGQTLWSIFLVPAMLVKRGLSGLKRVGPGRGRSKLGMSFGLGMLMAVLWTGVLKRLAPRAMAPMLMASKKRMVFGDLN